MKRNVGCLLLGLLSLVFAQAAPVTYQLDPEHTYPSFAVSHFAFSTARGMFTKSSGFLTLDREAGTGLLQVNVETASVTTGNESRDRWVRSRSMFYSAQYPIMRFVGDQFKFEGGEPVEVSGQLTLRDVTLPVTFVVDRFKCGPHPITQKHVCGGDVRGDIIRSDFGMGAFVPFVGDTVHLLIQVEALEETTAEPTEETPRAPVNPA